jgi:hypothetical protein
MSYVWPWIVYLLEFLKADIVTGGQQEEVRNSLIKWIMNSCCFNIFRIPFLPVAQPYYLL